LYSKNGGRRDLPIARAVQLRQAAPRNEEQLTGSAMYQPEAYSIALLFMVITMLCWGSWVNTMKLTPGYLLGVGSIAIAPTVTR
jgi:hypothetical protein